MNRLEKALNIGLVTATIGLTACGVNSTPTVEANSNSAQQTTEAWWKPKTPTATLRGQEAQPTVPSLPATGPTEAATVAPTVANTPTKAAEATATLIPTATVRPTETKVSTATVAITATPAIKPELKLPNNVVVEVPAGYYCAADLYQVQEDGTRIQLFDNIKNSGLIENVIAPTKLISTFGDVYCEDKSLGDDMKQQMLASGCVSGCTTVDIIDVPGSKRQGK